MLFTISGEIFDGLDPIFGRLDELMVIGGDSVIFVLSWCEVLFFDDHYHAYAVTVTSQRLFLSKLLDHNIYHGHKLANGYTYTPLNITFCSYNNALMLSL